MPPHLVNEGTQILSRWKMHFSRDPQECVLGSTTIYAEGVGKEPGEVHNDLAVRRVLLGPGKEGICLALGSEGRLTEWAQHGSLSTLSVNVFSDV